MDTEEKFLWVLCLWTLSLASTGWLVASIATNWGGWGVAYSPLLLFPIFFMVTLIAWLFRVTYLAGKRRY